ncbi:MAG: HNH endonuclease [Treponema sp.]|jgi:hypothetical protein|nr:HNH endonuclease [Treponema sp.]
MEKRIQENELVLPSLFLMEINDGHITTEKLIPQLREIMRPSGEDLEILNSRNDDKFSQKVRNLKAHNTFERLGYAEYTDGVFSIVLKGQEYLEQNRDILTYLLNNDFSYPDLIKNLKIVEKEKKREIQIFDENLIIQEGMKIIVEREVYIRSKKLRDYALDFYQNQGKLCCSCCGFNFSDFYGKEIGDEFIEMHHIRPIFQYKGDNLVQTLKDAVHNVAPVCSNCHRMIHRHGRQPLQMEELAQYVKRNGIFNISAY